MIMLLLTLRLLTFILVDMSVSSKSINYTEMHDIHCRIPAMRTEQKECEVHLGILFFLCQIIHEMDVPECNKLNLMWSWSAHSSMSIGIIKFNMSLG